MPSERGRPFFLVTKTDRVRSQIWERSCPESIRLQKVASKQQTGAVTIVPVAEEEGLHDCVGPTRGPGRGPDGQLLQNGHHVYSEGSRLSNRG